MAYKIAEPFWDQKLKRYFGPDCVGSFYPCDDLEWIKVLLAHKTKEGNHIIKEIRGKEDSAAAEGK